MAITKSKFSMQSKGKIGLDIGTYSIKVVELHESHGRHTLINLGIKVVPMSHRADDKRDVTAIANLIKDLLSELGIKANDVVFAIPGSRVSIKVVKVFQMPEAELMEAVKWELRRQVQFPVEDAVIDFTHLGKVVEEGITKIQLLVAAAPRDAVNEQLDIIKEAGLNPQGIDVAPFAVLYAVENVERLHEDEAAVLVDIGYRRTSISLVAENTLQFTREATIGGDSFTEALLAPITIGATRVSLDHEEAENIKYEYGIPSWDSNETTEEKIPLSQIYVMLRPVLEKLMVETGRSFDFFARQLNVTNIDKVVLSGGGAMLKGLPEFLAQGLKLDVQVANPLQGVTTAVGGAVAEQSDEMSADFAVATGLALTVEERIDLLPHEIKEKRQRARQGAILAVAAVILVLIFGGLYLSANSELSGLRKELSKKRLQLSATATPTTKLPQLRDLRERVRLERTLLPQEPFVRYPWTNILKEISNAVPSRAMIIGLSVETDTSDASAGNEPPERIKTQSSKLMKLQGIIFDNEPDDRIGLNGLARSMEISPLFSDVKLVFTQDSAEYEQAGKSFEFACVPSLSSASGRRNEGIAAFHTQ